MSMDELLKTRIEAVHNYLYGLNERRLCRNYNEIKPFIDELFSITLDSELHVREYGAKLVIIINKIRGQLQQELEEEGDVDLVRILLDVFNSLYVQLYSLLQR